MKIRVGTRRSPLALWQARHVGALLREREPGLEIELVEIVTKGDKIIDAPLAKVGGKGLFVKEIEEKLLAGAIDLAVHSLKDMPAVLPEGLVLAAIPEREDPRDAFVSSSHPSLGALSAGARVGTSSLRRACQLKAVRPDLEVVPIRGNVQTRLDKIDAELDAGVLAAAGLKRLGLGRRIAALFDPEVMVPAPGQGALAIETRGDDSKTLGRVAALEDATTRLAVGCERAFLARLGGGCQVPIAGYARVSGNQIDFMGMVGDPDGRTVVRFRERASFTSIEDVESFGRRAAEALLARGAADILAEVVAPAGIPES
ncbi:MAG: hydroxymethylbilane synthase [Myxococcales bacterium]|jgi:hydroxymethylbilane synthase